VGTSTFSINELHEKSISVSSSSVYLTHASLSHMNLAMLEQKSNLSETYSAFFVSWQHDFHKAHAASIAHISNFLSHIDVQCTHAHNAQVNGFHKPIISDQFCGKSYIDLKAVRHPIVERMCVDTPYVSNDISLGVPGQDGIMLFGVNCCGKSTLSKSIALSVIMAQAGSYVPCHMTFFPYEYVFTRIPNGDDMYRGMSTFANEISELRHILNRCTRNSLVVGDEIAHGSESVSGVSIVATSILQLANLNASFVFATHLHGVLDVRSIRDVKNVTVKHMAVIFDQVSGALIYNRKLQDGPGSAVYGLEVCKAMNLSKEFLDKANEIRREVEQNIVGKSSRYNRDVYMTICTVCKINKACETHHICQQKDANEHNIIFDEKHSTVVHMNKPYNLLPLCEECHHRIHHNNMTITGFEMTTMGPRLVMCNGEDTALNGEDDCHEHETVMNLRRDGKPYTYISKHTGMSIYKIKKIIELKVKNGA
jgi:DNA mismatch repair protein MutS